MTIEHRHTGTHRRPQSVASPALVAVGPGHSSRHPNHRRVGWEVYFVIGVAVALALILGAGLLIADQRSRAVLERTFQSLTTAAATSTTGVAPANTVKGDARSLLFGVDPNHKEWNLTPSDQKTVYLTIDDGPSENTEAILDILDRYGCKATFFVVGHNESFYPYIGEAYRRGHTIGMHTFSHDYGLVYGSEENYFSDLDAISSVVREQIGYVPAFIRFPGGSSNQVSEDYSPGIMARLIEEVANRGFQYYDWNASVGDGSDHSAEELISYATAPTDATNVMLLCHDAAAKKTTVEALPAIIEHYQALGYEFDAIDPTSWVCHHDFAG